MKKALLFIETTAEVVPEGDAELKELVGRIISHTVTVETPSTRGNGLILADGVITSSFLVGAYTTVTILLSKSQRVRAVVASRDEENHIAKLKPLSLGRDIYAHSDPLSQRVRRLFLPEPSNTHAIGDPLLVLKNTLARASVRVGAALYTTKLCERKESEPETTWQIDPTVPQRIIGSGVWDIDGGLVGLALGKKIPPTKSLREAARRAVSKTAAWSEPALADKTARYRPRVYTVPAEILLNFAETA